MANLFDYIDWRGDLDFQRDCLCEVDNLIFSELAYIPWEEVLDPSCDREEISLQAAATRFQEKYPEGPPSLGVFLADKAVRLLYRLSDSHRFSTVLVQDYASHIDAAKDTQFSATTFRLPDGTFYIAFRGTDDSLAGWKEDFYLAFREPVPAQQLADLYLREIAERTEGNLYVGGHSKGGNLAVYAAAHAPGDVQARMISVYSNDGPGFTREMVTGEAYRSIVDKVVSIIPHSSVIGMLLEHEERYKVVKSRHQGLFQHDGFYWEVKGRAFVEAQTISRESELFDAALKNALRSISDEQLEQFIESLFQILEAAGAGTLSDLGLEKGRQAISMLRTYTHMDEETKELLAGIVRLLFREQWQERQRRTHRSAALSHIDAMRRKVRKSARDHEGRGDEV